MILPLTSRGQSFHIPLWAPRGALFFAYRRRGSSRKMPVARQADQPIVATFSKDGCAHECASLALEASITSPGRGGSSPQPQRYQTMTRMRPPQMVSSMANQFFPLVRMELVVAGSRAAVLGV